MKEVDCEKATRKETNCEKAAKASPSSSDPYSCPASAVLEPWTFRLLIVGVVALGTGAYSMVNIPAICPPGTVICHHGAGAVTFDHDYFANVGRILGMDGGGSVSVSHTEVHNAPMP